MITIKARCWQAPILHNGEWIRLPATNMVSRSTEVAATTPQRRGAANPHRFEIKPVPLDAYGRGMKWCTECQQWVSRDGFHVDRSRRDGLTYACAQCRNERERERYHRRRAA